MLVETRYVAGSGLLLGAGPHWLLVTDPGDEDVVAELWAAVGEERRSHGGLADRVLEVVERAFDGEPPALALVDLSAGATTSVSRGTGRVRAVGDTHVLALGSGASLEPGAAGARRLVGGVVAADRAEVRTVAARVAPQPTGTPAPAATGPVLIDGIPEAILAARGPDGPPPRRAPEPDPLGFASDFTPATVPVDDHPFRYDPGLDTGVREATQARQAMVASDDHDGHTVMRDAPPTTAPEPVPHLRQATHDTVLAVSCPSGHLTPPELPACRVCRQPVAPQQPRRVQRPVLGGLRLPTGEVVPLDRGVVLGRRPAPLAGSHDWPHLVHLPPDHSYVSRLHLQLELDGWHVVARDLDSRGGTWLLVPGRDPERLLPREPYVLEPGWGLDLAEVYEVRFEVGPGASA